MVLQTIDALLSVVSLQHPQNVYFISEEAAHSC